MLKECECEGILGMITVIWTGGIIGLFENIVVNSLFEVEAGDACVYDMTAPTKAPSMHTSTVSTFHGA